MSRTVTVGGNRLGSGKKLKLELKGYERSTHDIGYVWRSSLAPGTLVPFMSVLGLPGDTFDINLNADVKTLPTLGALFGSYKLQLDIFTADFRLYQGQLHNNKLGIGMDMSKVKFPTMTLRGDRIDYKMGRIENQQISQSALLAYLGVRGIGDRKRDVKGLGKTIVRNYNATALIAYWDIYKTYYANKQENIGALIDSSIKNTKCPTMFATYIVNGVTNSIEYDVNDNGADRDWSKALIKDRTLEFHGENLRPENIEIYSKGVYYKLTGIYDVDNQTYVSTDGRYMRCGYISGLNVINGFRVNVVAGKTSDLDIVVKTFDLENIDKCREDILSKTKEYTAYKLNDLGISPYSDIIGEEEGLRCISRYEMQGLGLKTYQSDMLNNWISTEWIDGDNGISAITAVDVSEGTLSMDALNLSQKVYDMLNRIAVSGGSYDDWLEAVYDSEGMFKVESPVYHGGLSREIVFQEVVSTASQVWETLEPLGTLAGRGVLSQKHKGGSVTIKVKDPCYIIGIVSITPRVDYSQGNDFDIDFKTLNDLHKPGLDGIGFQDLITTKMAFWDEDEDNEGNVIKYSAGKQPAWLDYMSNVNKCYGEFTDEGMFMTLNRRFEPNSEGRIGDVTTYIDPKKYNYVFAETKRNAQNFWVQIGADVTARRVMSAKIIPNL